MGPLHVHNTREQSVTNIASSHNNKLLLLITIIIIIITLPVAISTTTLDAGSMDLRAITELALKLPIEDRARLVRELLEGLWLDEVSRKARTLLT